MNIVFLESSVYKNISMGFYFTRTNSIKMLSNLVRWLFYTCDYYVYEIKFKRKLKYK